MTKKTIYLLSTMVLFVMLSFIRHLWLLLIVQSPILHGMTHRNQLCTYLPYSIKGSILIIGLLAGYHVGQHRRHIVYELKCHWWFKKHCKSGWKKPGGCCMHQ